MLLTLPEIKGQLRIELDFTEEDDLLNLIGVAVEKRTETFLNRKLYTAEVPVEDEDGVTFSEDIKLGMLLLVTHFYENRSSVSEVEKLELPLSYTWLVSPYRFIPL